MAVAAVAGLAYPFLVYFGLTVIPPQIFVLFGLGVIGLRILCLHRLAGSQPWIVAFILAGFTLTILLLVFPELAVKTYPIVISLTAAAVFAMSLRFPPTVVERLARLTEPSLPAAGVIYTRRVTQVWVVFLVGNAGVSAATAVWGSLGLWTLWNGLLSYLAMGILFSAEFLVRRRFRRSEAAS
jgi:uncharacterized membrane protein